MINCLRQKIRRFLRICEYDPLGRLSFGTLELAPDEILVLSTEHALSDTYRAKLSERIVAQFQVIVLEAGMTLSTLRETKNA